MINFIDIAELTMKMYDTYLDEPDHFIYLIQVDDNNDHESTDTNRSWFNRNSQPTAVFLDGPTIVQMISPKKGVWTGTIPPRNSSYHI